MKSSSLTIATLLAFTSASAVRQMRVPRSDNTLQSAAIVSLRSELSARPEVTADDQPNDRADRLSAAQVRRVIVQDDTLSIYAHNVKVIVVNGTVTLEGPVHSNQERLEIVADAATVLNPSNIVNHISIA